MPDAQTKQRPQKPVRCDLTAAPTQTNPLPVTTTRPHCDEWQVTPAAAAAYVYHGRLRTHRIV